MAIAAEPRPHFRMPSKAELEAELCRRSLHEFVRRAWHVIEPGEFMDGWHIRGICEHLEAAYRGDIRRLLIMIPPRSMKSLLVSVFFPAWVWAQNPEKKFLSASYAQALSTRDSRKCRSLIESSWYQDRFGDKFKLAHDNNAKMRFSNDAGGERIATSVGGAVTGDGADFKILDDPHNVLEAESQTVRESVHLWRQESWSSRLNDPRTGVDIVIMQRVHEDDVAARIIAGGEYVCLVIPQEFEADHRCRTEIGWEDPRTDEGELMWPERNGTAEVDQMKRDLGSYAYAAQHQQRPRPRGGGKFRIEWFQGKFVDAAPATVSKRVRYWDPAASTPKGGSDPDWTAGCRMSELAGQYFIEDMRRFRETPQGVRARTRATAEADGVSVAIWREEEGGSSGKEVSDLYARQVLQGFAFHSDKVTGSKDSRSDPFAAACEAGNVFIVRGEWNQAFLDELCSFPMGKHDDQHDAAAGAFNKLATKRKMFLA